MNDEPEQVYRVGESFAEDPGDHLMALAQMTARLNPAHLLAISHEEEGE